MQTGSLFQQTQLSAKLRMEVKKAILKSWSVYACWSLAWDQI